MCVSIIVAVQETSQVLTNGIANTPTGYSLICLNSVSLALQQVVALPYRKTAWAGPGTRLHSTIFNIPWGLKVAYWLKHWTADRKVQDSSPTCSRDLFLFWVHSALPQKLSRRFTFVSFGGDIKPSISGNPLILAS